MRKVLLLLTFITVFFNNLYAKESIIYTTSPNEEVSRYKRAEKAISNIKSEDIIKIIVTFQYDQEIAQGMFGNDRLRGTYADYAFYKSLFSYVESEEIITDSDQLNAPEFLEKIRGFIANKKIVILMYAGHGEKGGGLPLGSYKNSCVSTYNRLLENHPNYSTYTHKKKSNAWIPLADDWLNNGCDKDVVTKEKLFGSGIFSGKKVVFFNNSCHSGSYKAYRGNPLNVLVYAAEDGQKAKQNRGINGITESGLKVTGGLMNFLLKRRLGPAVGCKFDGVETDKYKSKRDLVLTLFEFTYDVNYTYKGGIHADNVFSIDEQVMSLPVQIFTEKDCGEIQPLETREWEEFDQTIQVYSSTVHSLLNLRNDIYNF